MKLVIYYLFSDAKYIQNEIHVIKEFKHENIINYYESFIGYVIIIPNFNYLFKFLFLRNEFTWIVMEFCSGGSIQDFYKSTI
jgi:serine/threonine protein kinase